MRVMVVGASGAIGTRLVPQLADRGHEVIGTFSSPGHGERVRALGAQPVLLDLLDPGAVRQAVLEIRPGAIIHQATALAGGGFSRKLDRTFAQTNRLRTEGTDALLAAAREAGGPASSPRASPRTATPGRGDWSRPKTTRSTPAPPAGAQQTNAAMAYLDRVVTEAGGIALRYGGFYGNPATSWSRRSANGSSRSSATARASPHGSTSTMPPRRPCSRSNTTARPVQHRRRRARSGA